MKRVLVLSDLQIPLHDRPLVSRVLDFAHSFSPDEIYCVGDEADQTEVGRWVKGLGDEYAGTLASALDEAAYVMASFAGIAPLHISRSNHADRLENYVARYAPALASLKGLRYEALLGYEDNPAITYHVEPWQFAPGWYLESPESHAEGL